jgi:hypothetical protein
MWELWWEIFVGRAIGNNPARYAGLTTGFPGLLCLGVAGALVGVAVRDSVTGSSGFGSGPILAVLGLFPLLILVQFARTRGAFVGGACWGGGAAIMAAGFDPALWIAFVLGPAVFAFLSTWITRRIGFSAVIIAVLWMLIELAMIHSGLAPHGVFASLAEGSSLAGGLAAWLGSAHVALLFALLASGVIAATVAVLTRLRHSRSKSVALLSHSAPISYHVAAQMFCAELAMPRAPPRV